MTPCVAIFSAWEGNFKEDPTITTSILAHLGDKEQRLIQHCDPCVRFTREFCFACIWATKIFKQAVLLPKGYSNMLREARTEVEFVSPTYLRLHAFFCREKKRLLWMATVAGVLPLIHPPQFVKKGRELLHPRPRQFWFMSVMDHLVSTMLLHASEVIGFDPWQVMFCGLIVLIIMQFGHHMHSEQHGKVVERITFTPQAMGSSPAYDKFLGFSRSLDPCTYTPSEMVQITSLVILSSQSWFMDMEGGSSKLFSEKVGETVKSYPVSVLARISGAMVRVRRAIQKCMPAARTLQGTLYIQHYSYNAKKEKKV
ncbi:hypothetical protein VNO77_34182 [Canavalia gladiata]|uniref:Uncharacterized protein n=1 Tax=Canavalia gladiata TaxID=3824 RepID=A0AAN9Q1J1_CANGL